MSDARSSGRADASIRDLFAAQYANFWRLWFVGLAFSIVRWLETVAVGIVVYERTGSALTVAMMTMLRMLPMGLFGAFLGAWAERVERRASLIGMVLVVGTNSALLTALAYSDRLEVWHLGVACFISGLGWATDNPVRRVMIGDAVGPARMGMAMSLDVGVGNASRMVGPTVSGLLLAAFGIVGAFAACVVLYCLALIAACQVRYRNSEPSGAGSVIARIADGLRMVRGDARLMGILVVTVIYNVFGFPLTSMIPVIGRDRLNLGPEGIGILTSMDGVGAFTGAVLVAMCARPAWYGKVYVGGVLTSITMLSVFALLPGSELAGMSLICNGLGGAGFATMQATLVYLASPPEMRSRILGVLSVCIGSAPIGFFGVGLLADAVGAPWATAATGATGLLAMAATWRMWRLI